MTEAKWWDGLTWDDKQAHADLMKRVDAERERLKDPLYALGQRFQIEVFYEHFLTRELAAEEGSR